MVKVFFLIISTFNNGPLLRSEVLHISRPYVFTNSGDQSLRDLDALVQPRQTLRYGLWRVSAIELGSCLGGGLDIWIVMICLTYTPNSKSSGTLIITMIVPSLAPPVNNSGHLKDIFSVWRYQISLPEAECVGGCFYSSYFFWLQTEIYNMILNIFHSQSLELLHSRWLLACFLCSSTRLFTDVIFPPTQLQTFRHYTEAQEGLTVIA